MHLRCGAAQLALSMPVAVELLVKSVCVQLIKLIDAFTLSSNHAFTSTLSTCVIKR